MKYLFFFLCSSQLLFAQVSCSEKIWDKWYFGEGASLDYNGGVPNPAPIAGNAINSAESCASISDQNGNVLFYTDGITVWNKNNAIMLNGTGLLGDQSSMQGALIVPAPGSSSNYYIFTTDYIGSADGLRYSIVDMTGGGGNGAVTTKNILLTTPVTEKLTAVMSSNGCDIWIITHDWNSDAFRAYLLTVSGIIAAPIISNVGSVHSDAPGTSNATGQLKASPDGKRLACAINLDGKVEVFDFNNATGQVTNPISIGGYTNVIGVEFSPNNDVLYFTTNYRYIRQADLTAGTAAAVIASVTQVGGPTNALTFTLQWSPDGKIYATANNQNYLSVINNPNVLGAGCNFVDNGQNIPGKSKNGLPNTAHINFTEPEITASNSTVCVGDDASFSIPSTTCKGNKQWKILNGLSSIISTTSHQATLNFMSVGTEQLVIIVEGVCGTKSDTFNIEVQPCTTPAGTCGDKQFNNWYFGIHAALDFNSGSPVAVSNSVMEAEEGSASISDNNGNLLFYTGGDTVFNKNHVPMANGGGLAGWRSSTQSSLIVPQPGSSTRYYIFTTADTAGPDGLKYSIVDMTASGGDGAVTTKNIPLLSNVVEKVTAVMATNNCDIWIITHLWNSDAFYTYLLTAAGLSAPIVSNVGSAHVPVPGTGTSMIGNTIGYLKASPDGSRLAAVISYDQIVEVFDFDNTTGLVSNPITIPISGQPYGVEFSPDNSKLYTNPDAMYIIQFDLNAGTAAAVIASNTTVANVGPIGGSSSRSWALQLGPDDKIYSATYGQNYLGVINNPNALGTACNFVDNGVTLPAGTYTIRGLPNNVHLNFDELKISATGNIDVCIGDNEVYTNDRSSCMSNIQWTASKGLASVTSSTDDDANLTFNIAGTEELILTADAPCGIIGDTFNIEVQPCTTPAGTCGENQWNNWYFGKNAGITFNSGSPVVTTNGAMDQPEGVASVSDYNGNLLFYTDGMTVWNKNHAPMLNGMGLLGHASSTHSATIVPLPGSSTEYYIFTLDQLGNTNGLNYSIVDITLAGGLGDVNVKNTLINSSMTEKLAATVADNGCDVWVVGHAADADAFHAYLLTQTGLNTTPVISNLGLTHVGGLTNGAVGQMKISSDGSKLACAIASDSTVQIFDFDNVTGIVSNVITVTGYHYPYGIEFSPDNSKLYFTWSTPVGIGNRSISQLDLTAANVPASAQEVGGPTNPQPWGLQLGPDGKVYCAKSPHAYLGAINSPNTLGIACNYDDRAITLAAGTMGNFGLPNFVNSFYSIEMTGADDVCIGDNEVYTNDRSSCMSNIQWTASKGLASVTSFTDDDANLTFNIAGTEELILTADAPCGIIGDTITITIKDCGNPQPLTGSTSGDTLCEGDCFDLIANGTGGAGTLTYSWSSGQTGAGPHNVCPTVTTEYILTITDSTGATFSDTAVLVVTPNSGTLILSGNQTICNGDSVQLVVSGGTNYTWSPATGLSSSTSTMPWAFPASTTTYIVSSPGACDTIRDSVIVSVVPNITAGISNDTIICEGESVSLTASGGTTYAWSPAGSLSSTSGTTVTATPSLTTTYSVTVSSGNCAPAGNTVTITVNPSPTIDAGLDQTITEGTSTTINGTTTGINYNWSPGTSLSDSTIQNPEASPSVTTTYTLTSQSANGCSSTDFITITVESLCEALGEEAIFIASAFSPNGDGKNDVLYVRADTACVDLVKFEIYDRWGEKMFETELISEGWDGNYKNSIMGTAVFKYYLEAKSKDGDDIIKKGNIMLIR